MQALCVLIDHDNDGLCESQVHIVPHAAEMTVLSDTDGDGYLDCERVWGDTGSSYGTNGTLLFERVGEPEAERLSACRRIEELNAGKVSHPDLNSTPESAEHTESIRVRAPVLKDSLWCEARFRTDRQRVVGFELLAIETHQKRLIYVEESMPVSGM